MQSALYLHLLDQPSHAWHMVVPKKIDVSRMQRDFKLNSKKISVIDTVIQFHAYNFVKYLSMPIQHRLLQKIFKIISTLHISCNNSERILQYITCYMKCCNRNETSETCYIKIIFQNFQLNYL